MEVAPERLARWAQGFGDRHGGVTVQTTPDAVTLAGGDGATARLEVPWPPLAATATATAPAGVGAVAEHAAAARTALVVLVRRGGYAAGIARDGALLASAAGTRYVQGRTAAGGWSQQRFARRRDGQTAALVAAGAEAVRRVLARGPAPDVVVVGGDRLLLAALLDDARLAAVAALPRSPLLDVPDPRTSVLRETATRCRAVRIRLTDPLS